MKLPSGHVESLAYAGTGPWPCLYSLVQHCLVPIVYFLGSWWIWGLRKERWDLTKEQLSKQYGGTSYDWDVFGTWTWASQVWGNLLRGLPHS